MSAHFCMKTTGQIITTLVLCHLVRSVEQLAQKSNLGIVFAGHSKATVFPIVKSKTILRVLCHVDLTANPRSKFRLV